MNKLNASQAKTAYEYKNIRQKLMNTNQNIKFNKSCLCMNLTPNYIQIRINNKSYAANKTKVIAEKLWIKNEIKFLYIKKNMLNTLLYKKHLELSNILHPSQHEQVFSILNSMVNNATVKKIKMQHKKIDSLLKKQNKNNDTITINHKFYPRVINKTNIQFTEPELEILNKGLKHNFPLNSMKSQIISEILNAETAINSIKNDETKTVLRHKVNKKITSLQDSDKFKRTTYNKIIKNNIDSLKKKLLDNQCIITKADKGQTIVIMNLNDYNKKVEEFINTNNINLIENDPTNKFNRTLLNYLNGIKHLFTKEEIRHMRMIDPKAPTMKGLPKVHKVDTPIRPLINFTSAPTYKVSKKLDQFLRTNLDIQNNHSIKNSIELVHLINNTEMNSQYTMASFDIVNLFTNVPIDETIDIVQKRLTQNNKLSADEIKEFIELLQITLKQNYFYFNNKYFIQQNGLAMGSPLSSILSEIYLNHIENTHILTTKNVYSKNILLYKRYVDDTIIFYKGNTRQLDLLKSYLNKVTPNLQFTLETENKNTINFLDLTLRKENNKIKFSIYRKPTTTDHTIHSTSCHPIAQKMAAFNSMVHRLISIPMDKTDYDNELTIIKHIAIANGYKSNIIDEIVKRKKKPKLILSNLPIDTPTEQFIPIEFGPHLHNTINKELKKEHFKLACRTSNKLSKQLNVHNQSNNNIETGVYKINCSDCPKFYIGQTGRSFKKRFSEHLPKPSLKNQKSKVAEHLIDSKHNVTSIDNNLKILFKCRKSRYMNTVEELHIYNAFTHTPNDILNDKLKYSTNILFNKIYEINNKRRGQSKDRLQDQQVGIG